MLHHADQLLARSRRFERIGESGWRAAGFGLGEAMIKVIAPTPSSNWTATR
jgi:hypothetical protein